MNVIEFFVYACLIASPTECKPFVQTLEIDQGVCNRVSQMIAAEWAGQHPKYRIKEYSCRQPTHMGKEINA